MQTAASFDYEAKNSYSIRVRTTDAGGLTYEQAFMITVINVNEPPAAIQLSNSTVPESQSAGTTVGAFSTTDPDNGNTFTYTLVSGLGSADNGSFAVGGNTLQTAASFDYEVKNSYSVRVQTTDAGGLTYEQAFAITVTNVNEAPAAIQVSNTSISENQPAGTTVGTFSTTDPEGGAFTYSLVADASSTDDGSFGISGSTLQTAASFDYEVKNNYSIRVQATDAGGLTYEQAFTITVTNVNEAPTAIQLSSTSILENQPAGTAVGTFSTTDPDGGIFTYSLVGGTGGTDNGSFTLSSNSLRMAASFDYELKNSYSIRVRTTDAGGLSYEQAFTTTVANINEPPVARPDNVATDERTPVRISVLNDNGNGPDTDPEGNIDPSLIINATSPTAGLLTNHHDGTFTFDPNGAFDGLNDGESAAVSFEYQIKDLLGLTDTAVVTVLVTGLSPVGAPEIEIRGNGVAIPDGDMAPDESDHTDFGVMEVLGGTVTQTFTILNLGQQPLDLTGTPCVQVAGPQAGDFTVTVQPSATMSAGLSTTFTVVFEPQGEGLRQAKLVIANSDSDESPYDFTIQGTGTLPAPTLTVGNTTVFSWTAWDPYRQAMAVTMPKAG